MPGEVSAVDSRYVSGLEDAQLIEIVPVEEVAVETAHPFQRSENFLDAIDHVRPRDEPEIYCAYRREKLQPDVGRRRAKSERRLRIFLEVVRSQPMCLLSHEFLEVRPVQLGIAKGCLTLGIRQMDLAKNRRTAQRERDARTRQPYQRQRQCAHDEQESLVRARAGTDCHMQSDQHAEHEA